MQKIYRLEHAECSGGFNVESLGIFGDIDRARAARDKYVAEYLEEINEYSPEMVADFVCVSSGEMVHEETWIVTQDQADGNEITTRGDRDYISLIQDVLQ
jgi:hypothetical protein